MDDEEELSREEDEQQCGKRQSEYIHTTHNKSPRTKENCIPVAASQCPLVTRERHSVEKYRGIKNMSSRASRQKGWSKIIEQKYWQKLATAKQRSVSIKDDSHSSIWEERGTFALLRDIKAIFLL